MTRHSEDVDKLSCRKKTCVVLLLFATAIASHAQTFTTLVNFNSTNGLPSPYAPLVQGTDGNLYGTTSSTVFQITSGGTLTTLHSFGSTSTDGNGVLPSGGLVQATDGNFYGATTEGGKGGTASGTVFKITPGGELTTLYTFGGTSTDGGTPYGGLVQATDGNFYGTTSAFGANSYGTVFKITPGGTLTTLHSFATSTDGFYPFGALVQATDGNFYGTTSSGGAIGNGTVFKITSGGTLTTLHSFGLSTDGGRPYGGLVQAIDGNFYGATSRGGAGSVGTIFKITAGGTLTTLYSFGSTSTDGESPQAALVQATDGNFYGTTSGGGASGSGTVFKITPTGTLTTLHNFNPLVDGGWSPTTALVQATNGIFYGTTSKGNGAYGSAFSLTLASTTLPAPAITGVVNDASFTPGGAISTGSWVAIFGTGLAPAGDSRKWNEATEIVNGKLPTGLDGTSVTVNGKPAVVEFIQPSQVNIQPPDDTAVGPVQVVVTTAAGGSSPSFTVNYAQFAPGLFPAASPYIVAQHADNSYVTTATPAKPGEVIILWGTGFGPANPAVPAGQVFSGANPLANAVTVTIGGQPAAVDFAGIVGAGLVQINVHVPSSIKNGDAGVIATVGGASTQTTANMIPIQN